MLRIILKTLVLLSLYFLSAQELRAQIGAYRSELAVGASGGYVLSTIGFLPEVPQKQHTGILGGVTARYTCEKYFSCICAITAELNYVQLGWKENILDRDDQPVVNPVSGLTEQYERTIDYLQLPIFARLGWGRERRGLQFFFQAGPQFGYCLGERTKTNFDVRYRSSKRVSNVVAQDTMSVERRFDYGIAAGLGLEFSHRRVGHFLLEGRYYYGLGDIFRNSKRDYFGRSNYANIVIKLTYLFDISKTNNPDIK